MIVIKLLERDLNRPLEHRDRIGRPALLEQSLAQVCMRDRCGRMAVAETNRVQGDRFTQIRLRVFGLLHANQEEPHVVEADCDVRVVVREHGSFQSEAVLVCT